MERLRLPGSWLARFNLLGALSAAAIVAGAVGLGATRGVGAWPLVPLYWMAVTGGLAGSLLRLAAFLLERKGALEYVPEQEELLLRSRRLLTLADTQEPIRGHGPVEAPDDTPRHVKVLALQAVLVWAFALPAANHADWNIDLRFIILCAAVVPTLAAVIAYLWHKAGGALRLVREASED